MNDRVLIKSGQPGVVHAAEDIIKHSLIPARIEFENEESVLIDADPKKVEDVLRDCGAFELRCDRKRAGQVEITIDETYAPPAEIEEASARNDPFDIRRLFRESQISETQPAGSIPSPAPEIEENPARDHGAKRGIGLFYGKGRPAPA